MVRLTPSSDLLRAAPLFLPYRSLHIVHSLHHVNDIRSFTDGTETITYTSAPAPGILHVLIISFYSFYRHYSVAVIPPRNSLLLSTPCMTYVHALLCPSQPSPLHTNALHFACSYFFKKSHHSITAHLLFTQHPHYTLHSTPRMTPIHSLL